MDVSSHQVKPGAHPPFKEIGDKYIIKLYHNNG